MNKNYQVTARKWRPQQFKDVVGQEGITTALRNSILKGKIPHALLFSGVRGVGKTTTARIFAKAINCQNLQKDGEPCNECTSCLEILSGDSLNVIEIDGASSRGIENIRDIKNNVMYSPIGGKYRVYIIDEVHMLTNEASNALLKTLEEPPPHVIFILATTETNKILPTIKSRCQHYRFKKLHNRIIVEQLKKIAESESISFTENALYLIAEQSDGSMRDAQSLFDQIAIYTDGNIDDENTKILLGISDEVYFENLINSILNKNFIEALNIVNSYYEEVGELKQFVKGFITFLKDGFITKKIEFNSNLIYFSEVRYNKLKELFNNFTEEELINMIDLMTDLYLEMKSSEGERFLFEIYLFKLIDYKNIVKISDIKDELIKIFEKTNVQAADFKVVDKITTTKKEENIVENITEVQTNGKDVDAEKLKAFFYKMLENNPVSRPMIKGILSFKVDGNKINIDCETSHYYDFLTKKKGELENNFKKTFGIDVVLNFMIADRKEVKFNPPTFVSVDINEKKEPENPIELILKEFNGKVIE